MKTYLLIFVTFGSISLSFAQNTYVPDDNFEQALIDKNYDSGILDDFVPTANINSITNLIVNTKNITDLTGIEDFTALTNLSCSDNFLTELDITKNTALTSLVCDNNKLTSLDVTKNTALTNLACNNNLLTALDVTNNTVLTQLDCSSNKLIELDATKNVGLKQLNSAYNYFTSIDLSKNIALETLLLSFNELMSLDVSQNTVLTLLNSSHNQLISLNVKNTNNTNTTYFNTQSNPSLTCIEVDNATWSATNWTNIDATSTFVNNQAECEALSSEYFERIGFEMYPNPSNGSFTLKVLQNADYSIFDINGKQLKKGELYIGNNTLNIALIPSGLYLLQIKTAEGVFVKKMIKQ